MSFNIDRYKTDKARESQGVWVEAGAGLRLLIARIGNPEYTKRLSELTRPLRSQLQGVGEIEPGKIEEVTLKAMSEHVLLGWEYLYEYKKNDKGEVEKDENGRPIEIAVPYSQAKSLEMMKITDFAEIVSGFARRAELFRNAEMVKDEGNSSPA